MGDSRRRGDVDDISTWRKFEPWLCDTCRANCCRMPVEVTRGELVRMGVITGADAGTPIEELGEKLKRAGVIEHLYVRERIFILARTSAGDCPWLDPESRRCRIYATRPDTCREHPQIGPRPGFCAYARK